MLYQINLSEEPEVVDLEQITCLALMSGRSKSVTWEHNKADIWWKMLTNSQITTQMVVALIYILNINEYILSTSSSF